MHALLVLAVPRMEYARGASREPAWLLRVCERLRDAAGDVPGIATLAEDAGVHPVYLARVFRRWRGCSPGEFMRESRIDRAIVRIAGSARSLAEIALDCGFADQSHMSRAFMSSTGMAPRQLRALRRLQVANLQDRRRARRQAGRSIQQELPS